MKAVPETAQIPVIFLTADDDHEVETQGFRMGALDFITKPFIATVMLQRVRRTVELSRLRKHLRAEVAEQTQQIQQKGMLNQQLKSQTQLQQQNLQTQMNNNQQRIQQGQVREQPLPNTNGGMLSGGTRLESGQQHMLPPRQNGDMLNPQQ